MATMRNRGIPGHNKKVVIRQDAGREKSPSCIVLQVKGGSHAAFEWGRILVRNVGIIIILVDDLRIFH